jgi:hypothetical protein
LALPVTSIRSVVYVHMSCSSLEGR